MGLFDGRTGTAGYGSTAHVAALLGAPVVLVVDVRGQGRSLAALLHGFQSFDDNVRIAGVVLNRVGSARHEQVCRQACVEVGLPVLGALRARCRAGGAIAALGPGHRRRTCHRRARGGALGRRGGRAGRPGHGDVARRAGAGAGALGPDR